MKNWYIRNNDEHLGPYSLEELKLVGLYSDDFVWKEGMPQWTKANAIEELKDLLISVEHSLFTNDNNEKNYANGYPKLNTNPFNERIKKALNSASKTFSTLFKRTLY